MKIPINHSLFISTEVAELEANLPCKYSTLVKLVLYSNDMTKTCFNNWVAKSLLCMLRMNFNFVQE